MGLGSQPEEDRIDLSEILKEKLYFAPLMRAEDSAVVQCLPKPAACFSVDNELVPSTFSSFWQYVIETSRLSFVLNRLLCTLKLLTHTLQYVIENSRMSFVLKPPAVHFGAYETDFPTCL